MNLFCICIASVAFLCLLPGKVNEEYNSCINLNCSLMPHSAKGPTHYAATIHAKWKEHTWYANFLWICLHYISYAYIDNRNFSSQCHERAISRSAFIIYWDPKLIIQLAIFNALLMHVISLLLFSNGWRIYAKEIEI